MESSLPNLKVKIAYIVDCTTRSKRYSNIGCRNGVPIWRRV